MRMELILTAFSKVVGNITVTPFRLPVANSPFLGHPVKIKKWHLALWRQTENTHQFLTLGPSLRHNVLKTIKSYCLWQQWLQEEISWECREAWTSFYLSATNSIWTTPKQNHDYCRKCLKRGADLHMAQLMPLPPTIAPVKSRLVLPFWYRLTWVVPDKGPLNGSVCVCVRVCVIEI